MEHITYCRRAYPQNHASKLHQIFCARYLRPWPGSPLASLQLYYVVHHHHHHLIFPDIKTYTYFKCNYIDGLVYDIIFSHNRWNSGGTQVRWQLKNDSPVTSRGFTSQDILKLTYHGQHQTGVQSDVYDGLVFITPHYLSRRRAKFRTIIGCEQDMNGVPVTKKIFNTSEISEMQEMLSTI